MSGSVMHSLHEKKESLWRLVVSPTIWAAHLMLSYVTGAIWCAKLVAPDGSLGPVRWAIAVYSVLALIAIGMNGRDGWRRHRHGGEPLPHDDDTPEDRHRFLGYATALLAALSAIAVIYATLVVVFVGSCR